MLKDCEQLLKCVEYASIAHQNQRRKNSTKAPYINHPIEVASLVAQSGISDVNILQAALLHDVIEDCDVKPIDILNMFGEDVLNLVLQCTDDKSLDKHLRKRYQIEHAMTMSFGASSIKLADKISNTKSLLDDPPLSWSPETTRGYILWCKAIHNEMVGRNEYLDKIMLKIFEDHQVFSVSQEELETYYSSF